MWVLKFIGWSILKVLIIMAAILVVTLLVLIIAKSSFTEGWSSFLGSLPLKIVTGLFLVWLGCFLMGTAPYVLLGIVIFYVPIILITIFTPDPPQAMEFLDDKGNVWTLAMNN